MVPGLLIVEASLVAEQGSGVREPQHLQHSGSRALAQQLWCTCLAALRDLPGPGIEPVSPASAGGFLSTVPPGKSQVSSFSIFLIIKICLILLTTIFRGIKIDYWAN